jgi:hypothetical protein
VQVLVPLLVLVLAVQALLLVLVLPVRLLLAGSPPVRWLLVLLPLLLSAWLSRWLRMIITAGRPRRVLATKI